MNEFKILMGKLNKLTITKVVDGVIYTEEGFTISHRVEMNGKKDLLPSLQLILNIRYANWLVAIWGCVGEEDQRELTEFILNSIRTSEIKQDEVDRTNERLGKLKFSQLEF